MNILIKTTLRNIIGKPFRSIFVIFSLFVCSMTALFCFDLAIADSQFMDNIFKNVAGDGDITIANADVDLSELPADFPAYDYLKYRPFTEIRYLDIEGEYYVVHAERVRVASVDVAKAGEMGIIQRGLELGDGQVIVTRSFANTFECEIGDTVTLHDKNGDPVDLELVDIVPTGTMNMLRRGRSCIVNENTGELLCAGQNVPISYVINILDDDQVEEAQRILEATYPNADVTRLTPTAEMMEGNDELMGFMFMVFAIAFLLVIFITASLCERIVSERMSYIGTLRSLGLSARTTGLILLIENVFYGLIGSVPGTILYCIFRTSILDNFFIASADVSTDVIPPLSPFLVVGVIVGAVLIECIIPLRAQFKALKVSIRDIIFDNRDTEYKLSKFGITLGIILAVIGIAAFFLRSNIFAAAICLIACVMAVAFLYPLILKKITSFIAGRARKADKERWALASVETGSRKSAVGSGILSVSSSAMCIIIFTIAVSLMGAVSGDKYNCDVVVDTTSDSSHYTFADRMDGVTETELVYRILDEILVGDEEVSTEFYALPEGGFNMFCALAEVPDLTTGSISIESGWANRHDITEGDVVTLTFNPDSVFPIVKEFTVAGFFKNLGMPGAQCTMVLAEDDYISIFHDIPGQLLLRCDDPDDIASKIKTYAVGLYGEVNTIEQIREKDKTDNRTSVLIFTAIIGIALGMTIIGITSNQLIGFEGRKKECAVMLSTAMTRDTLTGILFRESILSALISGTLGLLTGTLLVLVIKDALASSPSLFIPITYNPLYTLGIWLGMIVLFALTALFPIHSLKKMKISEQIKCE